jgi:hypothetical protein
VAVPLLAAVALPALVLLRLGPDGGAVFGAAWSVAVAIGAAATVVVWRSVHAPDAGPGDDVRRAACERALLLAVPLVVVVLVGAPWILSVSGRHARDTGVGSLVLLALATVPYVVVAVASRAAAVGGRLAGAVVPPAVALVVAAGVGWAALPVLGVLGAAFGWLLGQTLVAASVLVGARSMITRPVA